MNDVKIHDLTDKQVEIIFIGQKVSLPNAICRKIDHHWTELGKSGKTLTRGDGFTITTVKEDENEIRMYLSSTDYAHYMATIDNILEKKYKCMVIYTAALVETVDNYIIIGEMASNTSTPGRLQFAGGGLDKGDLDEKYYKIDLYKNLKREIKEELGISIVNRDHVKSTQVRFLVTGGAHDFYAIMFKIELNLNKNELTSLYNNHVEFLEKKGLTPEFQSLLFLKNDPNDIEAFVRDNPKPMVDYLKKLIQITEMDRYNKEKRN